MLQRLKAVVGDPGFLVEAFITANLLFLGGDIALAHAANQFARTDEWAPIIFSGLATVLMVPQVVSARLRAKWKPLALLVGAASIGVGVAGMLFHLESAFFQRQTLHDLVYSAPFIAPLAYVGVGLLLLLNRMETPGSLEWARWVVFLTFGGFAGNFGLSLADHAQNGFFHETEWIGVVSAAFGASFLLFLTLRPLDVGLRRVGYWVMALQMVVGVVGFVLHNLANVNRPGGTLFLRFLYGAPAFAPLLFTNLALLGLIGIWALGRAEAVRREGVAGGVAVMQS